MTGLSSASQRRLSDLLEQHGCEALVVLASTSVDPDIAGFVGSARLGDSCVVATRTGRVALAYSTPMEREEAAASGLELLLPETGPRSASNSQASSVDHWAVVRVLSFLRGAAGEGGRVALAGSPSASSSLFLAGALRDAGWEVIGGSDLVRRWRRPKAGWELDGIRTAAQGTCEAMRQVAKYLAEAQERDGVLYRGEAKVRVSDLERAVAHTFADWGLEQPEGQIIALGASAGVPHSRSSGNAVVRSGETIVVDLFPRSRLFADCTRTFVVGAVHEEVRRAYDAVYQALRAATARVKAGISGRDLQAQTCDSFESHGYSTLRSSPGSTVGYVHGLGHGVGFQLHELPSFRAEGRDGTLAEGDVVTIEPGLYNPAEGYGIRLEDLLWLGPDGTERLTPLPYDLDPARWQASE